MTLIRSLLFGVLFYGGTLVIGFLYTPLAILPGRIGRPFFRAWVMYSAAIVRWVAGIRYRVVLRDGAAWPDGPAIYASKHQSAWETLLFNLLLPNPVFVLKKELQRIPFFGWYLPKMRQIAVDRKAGAAAMRGMVSQAEAVVADGHSIVIYPQGTRVAPGVDHPYHPGVYAMYRALQIPVVPIALDSGRLWARNGLIKRAGTITVSVLPAIPPGLDRKSFMARLEQAIETEAAVLHKASCG
ncbi:MAG: lysophospholipid acyltransferase family protein [Alphaproteobacteria bacterium]|nr:lysophospholipid acyltransferase family protein [Alphaproteobacteria bacterium]